MIVNVLLTMGLMEIYMDTLDGLKSNCGYC